jgi:hypothetical protein
MIAGAMQVAIGGIVKLLMCIEGILHLFLELFYSDL